MEVARWDAPKRRDLELNLIDSRDAVLPVAPSADFLYSIMNSTPGSGRIWMEADQILYNSRDYGAWRFPLAELRVFGEYTTDNGPMIDDWFMVFVTSNNGDWFESSTYAEGANEFRRQLAAAPGATGLHGDLFASTNFTSRVLWPAAILGEPLFQFTATRLPWWRRIMRFGVTPIQIELSPPVRAHLRLTA